MGAGILRDFSEAAKENLISQIDVINAEQWSEVTDVFGDIFYTAESWFRNLSIENYLGKVDEYHKRVLDQHDTTVDRLGEIFEAVARVDSECGVTFSSFRSLLAEESKAIRDLADLINPAMNAFTATNVKAATEVIVAKVEKANEKIDAIYDAELAYAQAQVAKNALLGLGGNILSFVGDLLSFGLNVKTANPAGAFADGWQLFNDVAAALTDFTAFLFLGIGLCGFKMKGKSKKETRELFVAFAEKSQKIDGMTELMEAEGEKELSYFFSALDMMAAYCGLSEALGNPKKLDGGELSEKKKLVSKIKNVYKLVKSSFEDGIEGIEKEMVKNTKLGKKLSKGKKAFEKCVEYNRKGMEYLTEYVSTLIFVH